MSDCLSDRFHIPFLFPVERNNHKFPGTAEAEGEPAGIAPGHIAHISAVTVKPPGIGEGRDDRPAEKAELGAMGMTGQGNGRALFEALIQKGGMMSQKHHGAPFGIPRKASSVISSISFFIASPRAQG